MLLDLLIGGRGHAPVGYGCHHDGNIGRQCSEHRIAHFFGALDMDRPDADGIGNCHRSADECDICTELRKCCGNRVPLPAGRTIGDV